MPVHRTARKAHARLISPSPSSLEADGTTGEILEAALALFGRRGFKSTTLSEVAASTGVSRPTLYARYPDKPHLFRAVVGREYATAIGAAKHTLKTGGSFREVLSQILLDYYGRLYDRFHNLPQIDELILVQSEHAHELVADARASLHRLLTGMINDYARSGSISLKEIGTTASQLADLIRLAPLSFKPEGTSRAQYHQRLKNLATLIAAALEADVNP